jgi:hypothetical protein
MENNRQQSPKKKPVSIYEKMKKKPSKSYTAEEILEAIKQDIRCIGLVPDGMQIEGLPKLSKQEIEDIRSVSDDGILKNVYCDLPLERRTEVVSQAAVRALCMNLKVVPEKYQTDELILSMLRREGDALCLVDKNRLTPEMLTIAFETSPMAIKYFPEEMITPDIAMNAISRKCLAIMYVPEALRTAQLCRTALDSAKIQGYNDHNVIPYILFPEVCLEHLKKYKMENADPFMVFGSINENIMTPEMVNLAVKMDTGCFQFVPERLMTPEICAYAVEKDWFNMRFVPEKMKTKELCEIAMNRSIHAQQLVPEKIKTPEMYLNAVKANGDNLMYVPEHFRTPHVCLQAVVTNLEAKEFVNKNIDVRLNIREVHGYNNKRFDFNHLSNKQIQKAFDDEIIKLIGINFKKIHFDDFKLEIDWKNKRINVKPTEGKPTVTQDIKINKKPEKRKRMKM